MKYNGIVITYPPAEEEQEPNARSRLLDYQYHYEYDQPQDSGGVTGEKDEPFQPSNNVKGASCCKCGKCGVWLVFLLVLGLVFVIIGGLAFPIVDQFVEDEIKDKVVISNASETYEIWQDVPVPVYMQFYMFNIGNPDEVKEGKTPYLDQIGPFTYRERRVKFDIVWNDNGTVTYKQNKTFHFIRNMSYANDDMQVTTINPLIPTIAQNLQYWNPTLKQLISWVLDAVSDEDLIMTRPVKELLWGYEDPALGTLNRLDKQRFPTTNIGYFIRKNYTDDGVYTVDTGEKDISQLGVITHYNGKDHVDIWTTKWANMVNGTDGSAGPPFRFDASDSPIFVSDICRSIRGIYMKNVKVRGIELRRFGGDRRDMANATVNPDNIGFCTPQTNCLATGLLNSTLCQEPVDGFKLPVVFSFPHFLDADPVIQNSVVGLRPNQEEHQTVLDQEPWTGLVLQVAKRLQINMYVEKVANIGQTHNVQTLFFPILWLNESSVVDQKWSSKLKDELFTPMDLAFYAKIGIIVLGGLMVIVASVMLVWRSRKSRQVSRV